MRLTGIYALADPRTGVVRYVGASVHILHRYRCHCNGALRNSGAWVRMLYEQTGRRPRLMVLELCAREHLAERERWHIATYRNVTALLNRTDGGDGAPGLTHSPVTRARISEVQRGRKASAETRARMSVANKAARQWRTLQTPTAIAKAAASKRGKPGHPQTPAARAKISAAMQGNQRGKGKHPTPEKRAKLRAANLGKTLSPEQRAKISATLRRDPRITERLRALAAAQKGKPLAPEHRAKVSAGLRRAYAEGRR